MPPAVSVAAISHAQAAVADELGIRVDHVIHHGIDVSSVPEGDGLGDDRGPYLLFLGRMNPDKGIVQAIEAARATDSRLLIAAKMREPLEYAFFDHVVSPRCVDGVEYLGEVDAEEKTELIAGAAALLNPVQWPEPFGLVMIEALASGTPVITTRHGAAREIVRDGRTGFLCDRHEALLAAIRDIGRIDRRECRADVARRFSVDKMVTEHLSAYRGLLARSATAALDHADQLSLL
jgi:glycosyltransferase involved in cell wall biosynthesis